MSGPDGQPAEATPPSPRFPLPQLVLPRSAPPAPARPRWLLASTLLVVTYLSTATMGAVWRLSSSVEVTTDLEPWLTLRAVTTVWGTPALLHDGIAFATAALTILLCHEMGHYLTCRYYGLPATLPYFLPVPVAFGTFGAFIRIRAPIRDKRQLFDVGIAGPLAGFVALVPFLLYGVTHSRVVAPLAEPRVSGHPTLLPGTSLAMLLVTRVFHGPLPAGCVLELHPFATAAWFGMLATSLNLIPLGQLDGGHVLYAALGRFQRRLALPLWLTLAAAGFLFPGWWLWALVVLLIGLYHPPVRDEGAPLGRGRTVLAVLALLLLVLTFMPIPVVNRLLL